MPTAISESNPPLPYPIRPWWRHGMVWLVIAGPVIVVMAGLLTFYLAARDPDPVLTVAPERLSTHDLSSAPAVVGRNHAATGQAPQPQATSSSGTH